MVMARASHLTGLLAQAKVNQTPTGPRAAPARPGQLADRLLGRRRSMDAVEPSDTRASAFRIAARASQWWEALFGCVRALSWKCVAV